jgi:hypothetical protein
MKKGSSPGNRISMTDFHSHASLTDAVYCMYCNLATKIAAISDIGVCFTVAIHPLVLIGQQENIQCDRYMSSVCGDNQEPLDSKRTFCYKNNCKAIRNKRQPADPCWLSHETYRDYFDRF